MTEPGMNEGQSSEGLPGTTDAEPQSNDGQSVASTNQTTETGLGGAETTFYDPVEYEQTLANFPEEIRGQVDAYRKSLQAGFTKKTQEFANERHKIDAYNAFEQNPQAVLQQLAGQYGYQLLQGQQQPGQDQNWEPQDWNEVLTRAEEQARQKVMQEFEPVLKEVKNLKETSMTQYLDTKYPDWRTYETEMRDLVTEHPTLAKDLDRLYDMAIPSEVKQSRATKAALAKLQANQKGAQVSGQGTTTQPTTKTPTKPLTFQEAANLALQKVRGVS